jgi:hypothetical protein
MLSVCGWGWERDSANKEVGASADYRASAILQASMPSKVK